MRDRPNNKRNNRSGGKANSEQKGRRSKPGSPQGAQQSAPIGKDRLSRTGRSQNIGGPRKAPFRRGRGQANEAIYIYGLHTVRAAFDNKKRKIVRLLSTQNAWERLGIQKHDQNLPRELADFPFPVEMVEPRQLDNLLGKDAIHQGIVAEVMPLQAKKLRELKDSKLVVVLDQVTDPHNVGAIMRSAVALGAGALITTVRNSPQESGVLAKSASGALEMIDHIQVKNLGDAIEELHFLGFQTIGLDSEGPAPLEETFSKKQIALVLGAEGKGLRQKTRTIVSDLARVDMPGPIKSLNVSNAATLSLYAANRFLNH